MQRRRALIVFSVQVDVRLFQKRLHDFLALLVHGAHQRRPAVNIRQVGRGTAGEKLADGGHTGAKRLTTYWVGQGVGLMNSVQGARTVVREFMEDYLAARWISEPFCLFDCDVPCDGSTVVIVSHVDHAPDLPHVPVHVNAIGTALGGRPMWDQFDELTTMPMRDSAASLWERTDLTPADVDVAELYDGFSFIALAWLEALGFCGKGEGGAFIEGGHRIARDGELPLNTHGGQLSAGRLHGYGFLHEACVQILGEAGERQVPNDPRTAIATSGGGVPGSALLLRAL